MKRNKQSKPVRRAIVVTGAAWALSCGIAWAEQLVVQTRGAEVVEAMSTESDRVEVVGPNQSLEILGRSGKWLNVRTPSGKTGYVLEAAVQKRTGGKGLSALTGGPSAAETSGSLAGRGLTPEAAAYAASHGYNTEGPGRMRDMSLKYKPDLKAFKQEGKVGAPQ
jgi:hypothetical protein